MTRRRQCLIAGFGIAALLAGAAVVQAQSRTLSSKDQAALDRLREAARAYHAVPEAQRKPVHDPRKFGDPIGVDDHGKAFPR